MQTIATIVRIVNIRWWHMCTNKHIHTPIRPYFLWDFFSRLFVIIQGTCFSVFRLFYIVGLLSTVFFLFPFCSLSSILAYFVETQFHISLLVSALLSFAVVVVGCADLIASIYTLSGEFGFYFAAHDFALAFANILFTLCHNLSFNR